MKTIKTYVGEVGRTVYPVDFDLGYLDRSHIFVYMGDIPTNQLSYSWPNPNQIELTSELPAGTEFKIRRITPRNVLFNDYENGSILEERNLDDSFKQTLMILEEWEDGSYPNGLKMLNDIDMNGKRILNLPKPLLPHEPLRLQDVNIDVSLVVPSENFALIRSTIEPTPINGTMWFDKEKTLKVGDDNVWKLVGGEASTGTGNGIVYSNKLPTEKVAGTTYFDAEKMESVYTHNDGDSLQYLAIPLLVGGIGSDSSASAGGTGAASTFTTAQPTGDTLVATSSTPEAHKVKAIIAGTGLKTVATGTSLTLNVDLLDTASVIGQGLVVTTDGSAGAKKQIKKLKAGAGVVLTSDTESVTITTAGAGGGIVLAEPPVPLVVNTTHFNPKTFELAFAYGDGNSEQYVTFPLAKPLGGSGSTSPSLKALPATPDSNTVYEVIGFYAGSTVGGGQFVWDPTGSKASHNGVTRYAPEAINAWDGTQSNIATLLNWVGTGSGVWVRTRPEYHIFEVGGGDGVSDNTAQLQKLLNSAPAGVTVSIRGAKCVIDSNLLVTDLRTLAGDWKNPDMAGPANAQYFNVATSAIYLNSAATIRLSQSSGIRNVLVYRKGMTFPTADDTLFSGTAIDAVSSTANLSEILVMGFDKLFVGSGQRFVIDRVFGDNRSGIEISGSPDVCYVTRCHMWPFSANTGVYPNSAVNRSGKAYYFRDVGDWLKISDCFSYAYQTGYDLFNVNSVTLSNCSSDHNFPNTQGNSIGFHVRGTSNDVNIDNAQTAAQTVGIKIATSIGNTTRITNVSQWSNSDYHIVVDSGNVQILSGMLRNAPKGLQVNSSSSIVSIDGVNVKSIAQPFDITVPTENVFIGDNIVYENIVAGSLTSTNISVKPVASATNLLLPATGDTFNITGSTTVAFVSGYFTGRLVNLRFSEACSVAHGGAGQAGIKLLGGVPFRAQTDSVLTLLHINTGWVEVARSVNGSNVQSYTPVISGSTTAGAGTYSVQDGKYYELGEMVFFTASVTWSAHTGTGGFRMSLPHTLADFGQRVPLNVYYSDLAVGTGKECAAFVGQSGNVLAVRAIDPSGGGALEFFDVAGTINISGFYRRG